jgi:hypothetical protein
VLSRRTQKETSEWQLPNAPKELPYQKFSGHLTRQNPIILGQTVSFGSGKYD